MNPPLSPNSATLIRVALVEDNPGLRESLGLLLNGTPGFQCVGAFASAEAALAALPTLQPAPEVVLMDIHLPGQSGIECVRALRDRLPQPRIVMLTIFATPDHIFQALTAGASGYLSKRTAPADLLAAIQEVHRGGAPMSGDIAARVVEYFNARGQAREPDLNLSPRETEILHHLAEGLLYKEIRDRLSLSIDTVQWHIRNIYRKLHVRSRAQAVAKLHRQLTAKPG